MKKMFAVLSTFLLLFVLIGCGTTTADDTTTAAEVTVLNWNIGAEPAYIDPGLNGASDGGDVISQTFEGLVREINGVVTPGIAETWSTSTDGLTVTFNLRHSNWSDGSALDADDFLYAWRRGLDVRTASEYTWIWEYTNIVGAVDAVYWTDDCDNDALVETCNVYNDDDELVGNDYSDGLDDETGLTIDATIANVGIAKVDDYTLTVTLIQPTNYIVSLLSFYHFMPVKEAAVEATDGADGAWAIHPATAVSNGAFYLTGYTTGDGLVLTKNPNFWDADNVHLTQINAKFIDEDASAYYAYQQGTLDVIPSVPAAMVPTLVAEDPEFHVFALLGTYYVNFNMDMPLFANAKLRKALAYSIDREAICEALSAGQIPATSFVPEGFVDNLGNDFSTTAGDFGIATDDGNYTLAQTLFKEAAVELGYATSVTDTTGIANFVLAVNEYTYMSNNGSGHDLIAQMIIESWNVNLGLTIEYENQEWAVFQNTRQDGDYEMSRGGWLTDYMDPSGMLAIFTQDNAYNDPNYASAAFNTLMTDAIAATDPAVHFAKLYDAQEQLMDDMPIIPLYYYSDTIYIKSYVKGWARSVLGSIDLTRVYIEGK